MSLSLLVLEGDGIGPEITAATLDVLAVVDQKFGLGLQVRHAQIGFAALETHGTTIPDSVIEAALAADGVLLGPVSHNDYPPVAKGGLNPSGALRKRLDLFANIRPAQTPVGLETSCKPVNLVTVRENTEGFYADRNMAEGPGEFLPDPDIALAIRKISRRACRRIAQTAFDLAQTRLAGHVTAVHKANVLRLTDGLFLEETRKCAAKFPAIQYDEVLVDAMAAHLVRDPTRYDVIVTTNMYGDILSDLAAELAGSLGMAGSLNAGEDHAMAQAQHGSAPDIAGRGLANPASLISSAVMLLDWWAVRHERPEFTQAARAMETALADAIANPNFRTADLGGRATTTDMVKAITSGI